jgi:hypothetical protein
MNNNQPSHFVIIFQHQINLNRLSLKNVSATKLAIFSTKVGKLAWIFWRFAFVCNRKRNSRYGKQDKDHLNA